MIIAPASFIETLRKYQLLDQVQLEEVTRDLQKRFPEARALAKELIQRGWLTPYQANQLFQGHGKELLLGPYVLLERIGEGGMGTVFKARHQKMKRVVAVKLIRKDRMASPDIVKRFYREIEAASQLSHPNVVMAHDAAEVDDTHYFAMEYVEGIDLAKMVKQYGPLPVEQATAYIRQAALGLHHAHQRGMVHRDIKPSNLFVNMREGVVKVLDMGLARFERISAQESTPSGLTQTGAVMGTPDYIAPEQAMSSHEADIRSDIYSLGGSLYYLLTGQVPFPGTDAMAKLLKHQMEEPVPLEKLRPEAPADLAQVMRKMMAKKPEERFQTPLEAAQALEPYCRSDRPFADATAPLSALTPTKVHGPSEKTLGDKKAVLSRMFLSARKTAKRWPWKVKAGLGAAVVFLLALLIWRPFGSADKDRPPDAAKQAPATKSLDTGKSFTRSLGMKMVLIPAGKFLMGSDYTLATGAQAPIGHQTHEGPQHKVGITSPFYMGAHEVTVGQFRAFAEAAGYVTDAERDNRGSYRYNTGAPDPNCTWKNPGFDQGDDQPVVCVSWEDAMHFCNWLTRKESKRYRLPTEAEWEYACRAGSMDPVSFGPTLSFKQANFNGGAPFGSAKVGPWLAKTMKVGSYPANAWGLYDMHGNGWEWCADWYDNYYNISPKEDPKGPDTGVNGYRIFRGGGWADPGNYCRSAFRCGRVPRESRNDIGFRVVCEP